MADAPILGTNISLINRSPLLFLDSNLKNVISEKFKTLDIDPKQRQSILNSISQNLGEEHPFDYEEIENLVKKFGLANAVIEKICDFTVGPGLFIESDDEEIETTLNKWMEDTNFKYHLRQWLKEALIKGSGYLEVAGLGKENTTNTLKVVNANSMYVKRDDFGVIKEFNQYTGQYNSIVDSNKVIRLSENEIIPLNINKIGTSAYGMGVVYSALDTINNFLGAQKSMHTLMRRKANSPVHWALGNAEKDDYPTQADINAFGTNLQFMNEKTEYVTGPNAKATVINYGDISDKFAGILDNDYKLLSYSFQVPETILGAGNVPEGLAKVQMDSFKINCKSKQEEISIKVKTIFKKVLESGGQKDAIYTIIWGQPSEDDDRVKIETLKNILSVASPGLKIKLEEQIANILGINFEEVTSENEIAKAEMDKQMKMQQQNPISKKPFESIDSDDNFEEVRNNYPISEQITKLSSTMKGKYSHLKHYLMNSTDLNQKNYNVREWVKSEYETKDIPYILEAINNDNFDDLKAVSKVEFKAGYLDERQTNHLKSILMEGFKGNLNLKEMKEKILDDVKLKNLYEYNSRGIVKDEDGKRIILLDKQDRAEMIVKTETVRMAAEGLKSRLKVEGVPLIKWVTAENDRVCPECNALDNMIFESSEPNTPPLHVNCQCHIEEISTQEKLRIVSEILEKKISPQEKELEVSKILHLSEEKSRELIKNFNDLKSKEASNLNEFVKKVGDEYCVISHTTGKSLGCFSTKSEAEDRLKQMRKFK